MPIYFFYRRLTLFIGLFTLPVLVALTFQQVNAQGGPTATAVPLFFPQTTPTEVVQVTITPSRTPTDVIASAGRIEAKSKDTGANLRASPSTDSEKLGTIFPGQFYIIVARYQKWIEIQYDKTPSGLAWVYEDIVNITGIDPAVIPTVSDNGVPTANVATAAARQTADYLTQTPGAPETATAIMASATGIFARNTDTTDQPTDAALLPTFTYPPTIVEATLPPKASDSTNRSGVPAIVPIIVLAGLGIAGLFISGLRRL